MRLVSLKVKNILSIEEASVYFPDTGLVLVDGWNHDTGSANGAGKTAIFNALSWCLFDEYPRGVSISDFVRHGSKDAYVCAVLEVNGRVLTVKRSRPKSFSAALDEQPLTDAEYSKLLPISYDQFVLTQYFAQGIGARFIDLNDSGRKDLLLRLMNADGFAESKKDIDSELKLKLSDQLKISSEIEANKARLSAYEESCVDVDDLKAQVLAIEEAIEETNKKINKSSAVQRPESIDRYSEMLDKLNLKLRDIASSSGKLKAYRQQYRELESSPPPEDSCDGSCPSCGTELDYISGEMRVHDRSSHERKLQAHRSTILAKMEALSASIKTLQGEVDKEDQVHDAISSIKQKIRDATKEYDESQQRIAELRYFVKQKDAERRSLQEAISRQSSVSEKVLATKHRISQLNQELLVTAGQVQLLQAASQVLSPTGAPAYVMDALVQGLNDKIQELIQPIWPGSHYELLSFKENKSGTVTSKMSDLLTVDGVKRPIGSLSGGERRCLSLAIDFALAEIVSQYTGADLNPLILDEPFDHLDASNRSRVIDLLREISHKRCIVVIDHASEAKAMFDRSIMVNKRNGISAIQDEIIS